jgi:hypothetical protein
VENQNQFYFRVLDITYMPYFIANKNFIYDSINDANRILILNLNLEQMTEISYDDAYDKIFFNANGADLILRSCKTPNFLNF